MKLLNSSSQLAAAEGFLQRFIDGDASTVPPEEMLAYAARATTEVLAAAQQVPIVVGYKDLPHLTKRQREVLEILNTGKTPKQARLQLHIEESTWDTHMSAINKALGTNGYEEAVKKARSMGILPYPE